MFVFPKLGEKFSQDINTFRQFVDISMILFNFQDLQ